jgi:hypothetical protein
MKGKSTTQKKIWWNPLKQKSEISGFSKSANPQNPSKIDDFDPILRILKNPHFSGFLRVQDFPQISSKSSVFVFLGLFSRFRTFWGFLDLVDFPPNFVKIDVFWGFGALFSKSSVWSFFVNFELFRSFFRNPRFGAFSSISSFFGPFFEILGLELFRQFRAFSVLFSKSSVWSFFFNFDLFSRFGPIFSIWTFFLCFLEYLKALSGKTYLNSSL